jgi:secretion/DNA translocation related CpaE-like protein
VVLAAAADLAEAWPAALAVGADDVVVPGLRGDLSAWLRSLGSVRSPHAAVTLIGGRGGAGASTAAVAVARAMAAERGACILVDADPWGGGIDLALGAEAVPGARWPDVVDLVGPDAARWLVASLPVSDGVSVLSQSRSRQGDSAGAIGAPFQPPPAVPADTVSGVLDACLASGRAVVVDLARRPDAVTAAVLARTRTLVVVVPAEVRACAAAAAVVDAVGGAVEDLRLLVRGPAPAGLEAEDVAAAVGVPSFVEVRPEPGLAAALERGDQVAGSARSPLRRWATALVESLSPGPDLP